MRYNRLTLVAGVCALVALVPATTTGSASAAPVRFEATLTASVTGGTAWCCGRVLDFGGSGTIMGVGAVVLEGHWSGGCSFPTLPTPCFRRLDLVLVARNGDRLSLRGRDEWTLPFDPAPEAMTWTSDESGSTGRFADFSASGTYTLTESGDGTSVTISLSGARHPARR